MYQQLGSTPFQGTRTVVDVLKNETMANGIVPLNGDVKNQLSEWVRVKLANGAYTSTAVGVNLFSVGAGRNCGVGGAF